MHWPRDLQGWPHRAASHRFAGPVHRWHVQIMADRDGLPDLLLLHGAGASTHSWRDLMQPLAQHFRVIVPDLPGHGFTTLGLRNRSGLDAMAHDLRALATAQGWNPAAIVGHSAGGAIALELTRQGPWHGVPVVGINAALGPFPGLAGVVFPILAQVMAAAPFVPRLMSRQMRQDRQIARVIESTGSQLDADGRRFYQRLASDPDHVAGTLRMMAQWDLAPLRAAFETHPSQVLLLAADRDTNVPPAISTEAAEAIPQGRFLPLNHLGHLAHEEDPNRLVVEILQHFHPNLA